MGKKRAREEDPEDPISKRINKLQIRHSDSAPNEVQSSVIGSSSLAESNAPTITCPKLVPSPMVEEVPHNDSNNNAPLTDRRYNPILSKNENPHYYEPNEMLYYCNLARQSRYPPEQN